MNEQFKLSPPCQCLAPPILDYFLVFLLFFLLVKKNEKVTEIMMSLLVFTCTASAQVQISPFLLLKSHRTFLSFEINVSTLYELMGRHENDSKTRKFG